MSRPTRPSPASLSGRTALKSAAAELPPVPEADDRTEPNPTPINAGLRDFKTIMARVNRAGWQELSRLAIEHDRNLEDLIIEACNDLLVREGFSPVMEKRSPPRR